MIVNIIPNHTLHSLTHTLPLHLFSPSDNVPPSLDRAHFTGKKLEVKQLETNPTASTYSMHEKSKDRNFDRAIAREMYGSGGRGVKPIPRRLSQEKEVEKEVFVNEEIEECCERQLFVESLIDL